MRIFCLIFSVFVLVSCNRDNYKAPKDLISEDQMIDVLYELMIMNAAKGVNKKVLEQYIESPSNYIFNKFNIDSLQFVNSNSYYAKNNEVYGSIYLRLKQKLESDKKAIQLLIKDEEKKIDSIKKLKIAQNDTVFEFNKKERSFKNRLPPKRFDSMQKRSQ